MAVEVMHVGCVGVRVRVKCKWISSIIYTCCENGNYIVLLYNTRSREAFL